MRSDDKRQRILAAATAVFAERDFHRVQVSDVATRAGVGKGTVYLYFPTKDALHKVALQESLDGVAGEIERAAAADAPAAEALRQIVVSILRFFWRRQHLLEVVQRFESRGGLRGSDRRQVALRAVERVLARHRLGGTGPARRLAAACLLGIARAAILYHAPNDRPEATAGRLVSLYLRGIGPAGGAVSRRQRGAA
jgi:AcrR family transcriptional regulator